MLARFIQFGQYINPIENSLFLQQFQNEVLLCQGPFEYIQPTIGLVVQLLLVSPMLVEEV